MVQIITKQTLHKFLAVMHGNAVNAIMIMTRTTYTVCYVLA